MKKSLDCGYTGANQNLRTRAQTEYNRIRHTGLELGRLKNNSDIKPRKRRVVKTKSNLKKAPFEK